MHAAVLADQPLEIALLILPFGKAHQCPGAGVEIRRIVVRPFERPDTSPHVVPLHAGGLTRLATDTAADIDQLCNLDLVVADRRRRQGRCRNADEILRLEIRHRQLLHVTGALVASILTRNALNSGVCTLASPTDGVSVLAP